MATVDYTSQIRSLRSAIAAGVLVVSIDGTTTTFAGFDDMLKRIGYLEDQQRQSEGKGRRRPVFNRLRLG